MTTIVPVRSDPKRPSEDEIFNALLDAIVSVSTPAGSQVGTFVFAESYRALVRMVIWLASHDDAFDDPAQLNHFAVSVADRLRRDISAKRGDAEFVERTIKDARLAESIWRLGGEQK
jgi:hypothetical protein